MNPLTRVDAKADPVTLSDGKVYVVPSDTSNALPVGDSATITRRGKIPRCTPAPPW
jgi:hypothetical protein